MATEAQRLISISLAKIAASRCVRGGVSLHKNLLVATVLQKARYIFMEEAFHMVHGSYLNQANSKFIQQLREQEQLEHELRQHDKECEEEDDASTSSLDDSELDIFSSSHIDSSDSLSFLNDSSKETGNINKQQQHFNKSTKESNPSLASTSNSSPSDLIYLDLDVNKVKSQDDEQNFNINGSNSISGQKRRLSFSDYESEDAIMTILPKTKQIKLNNNNDEDDVEPSETTDNTSSSSETDNCLSLDFLSNELSLTSGTSSLTHTATANVTMAPLDMSCNSSNTSASSSSSSSIDRITSLVSIFNFGNLQRSVSTPDLCSQSPSHHHHAGVDNNCCNLSTQRQILTV